MNPRLTIVGKGPSLANLQAFNLTGDVLALNHAIFRVREVSQHVQTLYTMQKDGCEHHTGIDYPGNHKPPHDCPPSDMIQPRGDEILIVSEHESRNCWASWHSRVVIDPRPWYAPSVVAATQWAIDEGVESIRFVSFDSFTRADDRYWTPDGLRDHPTQGYLVSAMMAAQLCAQAGVTIRWVTP